jgi:DNA repair protein RadC
MEVKREKIPKPVFSIFLQLPRQRGVGSLMGGFKIMDFPERERPRERLRDRGSRALSTPELLAVLLRTGRAGVSAVELGTELLKTFGSLEAVSRSSVATLARIPGIGESKAAQILAAFELGVRLQQHVTQKRVMESSLDVWNALGLEMVRYDQECVKVMVLNVRRELLVIETITQGTLNESLIHPREIFRPALSHQGYGIILVHNHPSGDPTPSRSDYEVTQQIKESGKTLEIPLLDHVILGSSGKEGVASYYSFRDAGIL